MSQKPARAFHAQSGWHGQVYSLARGLRVKKTRAKEYRCPCHPAEAHSRNEHAMRLLILIAPLSLLAAGTLLAADSPTAKPTYRERYGVLAERNIFLKDRSKPAPTTRGSDSTATTRETPRVIPELAFILTGIVKEEGVYRAYIEDVPNSKVLRLNVGDAVAAGKIAAIEIDAISYESAGQQVWVDVGRDLTGGIFNAAAATATTQSSTSPAGLTATPNTANLSMEEKMRLRRAQELNRK